VVRIGINCDQDTDILICTRRKHVNAATYHLHSHGNAIAHCVVVVRRVSALRNSEHGAAQQSEYG
jgi:hypothetical protein